MNEVILSSIATFESHDERYRSRKVSSLYNTEVSNEKIIIQIELQYLKSCLYTLLLLVFFQLMKGLPAHSETSPYGKNKNH